MNLVMILLAMMVVIIRANPLIFVSQDTYSANDINNSNDTVLNVLKNLKLTDFLLLSDRAGLTKNLTGKGGITVLAPSQDAFLALPLNVRESLVTNVTFLQRFIEYHVLPKNYTTSNMTQDRIVPTWLTNSSVRFNAYSSGITVNGAQLQLSNQPAANGIVHVLRKTLWPIQKYNAVDEIKGRKDLTSFASKIDAAKMADMLKGSGPFTIFAPSDAAFKKYSGSATATEIVEYHVVSKSTEYSTGLLDKPTLTTLLPKLVGGNMTLGIKIGKDGSITVTARGNSAKIVIQDIAVLNGVIHIIDTVLEHSYLYNYVF